MFENINTENIKQTFIEDKLEVLSNPYVEKFSSKEVSIAVEIFTQPLKIKNPKKLTTNVSIDLTKKLSSPKNEEPPFKETVKFQHLPPKKRLILNSTIHNTLQQEKQDEKINLENNLNENIQKIEPLKFNKFVILKEEHFNNNFPKKSLEFVKPIKLSRSTIANEVKGEETRIKSLKLILPNDFKRQFEEINNETKLEEVASKSPIKLKIKNVDKKHNEDKKKRKRLKKEEKRLKKEMKRFKDSNSLRNENCDNKLKLVKDQELFKVDKTLEKANSEEKGFLKMRIPRAILNPDEEKVVLNNSINENNEESPKQKAKKHHYEKSEEEPTLKIPKLKLKIKDISLPSAISPKLDNKNISKNDQRKKDHSKEKQSKKLKHKNKLKIEELTEFNQNVPVEAYLHDKVLKDEKMESLKLTTFNATTSTFINNELLDDIGILKKRSSAFLNNNLSLSTSLVNGINPSTSIINNNFNQTIKNLTNSIPQINKVQFSPNSGNNFNS